MLEEHSSTKIKPHRNILLYYTFPLYADFQIDKRNLQPENDNGQAKVELQHTGNSSADAFPKKTDVGSEDMTDGIVTGIFMFAFYIITNAVVKDI